MSICYMLMFAFIVVIVQFLSLKCKGMRAGIDVFFFLLLYPQHLEHYLGSRVKLMKQGGRQIEVALNGTTVLPPPKLCFLRH